MSLRVGDTNTAKQVGTTEKVVTTKTEKQDTNEKLQKGINQKANQYTDVPDSELHIIQEVVESKIQGIEVNIKLLQQKNPDSPNIQKYQKALNELKAEYKHIMNELESRKNHENKPKLDTRG